MDAVEMIEEHNRMCINHGGCNGCPLQSMEECHSIGYMSRKEATEFVGIIEKWSKEHAAITNAEKFREVFGISSYPNFDNNWGIQKYKEPEK